MTYVYADSCVAVGPLAPVVDPGSYDLCAQHAAGLSVPRGWEVLRLPGELGPLPASDDDLEALANAIRRVGLEPTDAGYVPPPVSRRKGHLAILADPDS